MRKIDIVGERYGRLTVVREMGKSTHGILWECVCDCGNKKNVLATNIKHGNTYLLKDFCDKVGISKGTFYNKLREGGEMCKKPSGKLVLNVETGVFYETIVDAAKSEGMVIKTLSYQLLKAKNNKTKFIIA